MYDTNNVFAKILRNEIHCKKIHENSYAMAFEDIHPKAPVHILVIPKGPYTNLSDFTSKATPEELQGFFHVLNHVIHQFHLTHTGYRVIMNEGMHAHQEVPHFHAHILGGRSLGPLLHLD